MLHRQLPLLLIPVLCLAVSAVAIAAEPPLIPRDTLFGNPDRTGVQLSPDGKHISFIAPAAGVLNVWVGPADNPDAAQVVTHDTDRGIRSYFWAYSSKHVLYVQDKGGDENWHLYRVDLGTRKTIDLTPINGIQARVQQLSPKYPDQILVGINDRDPQLHDIHRVNLVTGERRLDHRNDGGFAGFLSEKDMKLHFAVKMTPDGGSEVHRRTPDSAWTLLTTIPHADSLTTNALGLDESGKHLYMLDSRGRNTAALTSLDLASGKSHILAADERADISGVLSHPTRNQVQAVQSTYERRKWQVLDDSIKADLEVLKKVTDGEFNITSRTQDDRTWIVAYVLDNGPVRYYRYDRDTRKATFLFTNRKALEGVALARMHPVVIPARDQLKLVSYYTLPNESDVDGDGKPEHPLPMVLLVHGGPWGRDNWGYHPSHQWLANRGYAVLSVNFRGSTGFGKNFVNAADNEWSGKMHHDLIDAVHWATRTGIADKKRIGIMGGSYGGYATLVGLTYTPDVFACGVDIVGPSNLVTLLESIPPYWQPLLEFFTQRVGDHRTAAGRQQLEAASPLNRVQKITKPLLIGQGANDPRVKQAESDQIVQAMQKNHIPVTYVLFPDEGHGFAKPENRMSFNAVTEAFLAAHLGGRHQPMSEVMRGSTITIPTGGQHIPGLPPNLPKTPQAAGKDPA